MAVSGVSAGISNNVYTQLSSGSRINTAADDAAGLSIAEKTKSQINTSDAQSENITAQQSAAKIQDGGYAGVTDNLQRMRELALKASNGMLGDDERSAIQQEIDGLKSGIDEIVKNSTYNEKGQLDGLTSQLSAIQSFDVTGDFNIEDLDKALDSVSASRSETGAQMNAYEHAQSYNRLASYNSTASLSRLSDTEYGETATRLKQQETMNTYQIMAQKRQQEEEQKKHAQLLTTAM